MDRQGGLSEPRRLVVRARVPLPDTMLTGKGPFVARDVVWRAPVKLVASEPGAVPYLVYRLDGGGAWRLARSRRYVSLGRTTPGRHTVELAAREQRLYRDPSPLRLSLVYAPDPEAIVSARMKLLASKSPKTAARAASDIALAGPGVVAVLERKLAEAGDDAALAERLRALIDKLRKRSAPAPTKKGDP
jgi:hypothetical protein